MHRHGMPWYCEAALTCWSQAPSKCAPPQCTLFLACKGPVPSLQHHPGTGRMHLIMHPEKIIMGIRLIRVRQILACMWDDVHGLHLQQGMSGPWSSVAKEPWWQYMSALDNNWLASACLAHGHQQPVWLGRQRRLPGLERQGARQVAGQSAIGATAWLLTCSYSKRASKPLLLSDRKFRFAECSRFYLPADQHP